MLLKELLPPFVSSQPHPLDFRRLESVHSDTPHKTDMHSQSAMHARTRETDKDTEFGGCPLRRGRTAIDTAIIGIGLLDLEELGTS